MQKVRKHLSNVLIVFCICCLGFLGGCAANSAGKADIANAPADGLISSDTQGTADISENEAQPLSSTESTAEILKNEDQFLSDIKGTAKDSENEDQSLSGTEGTAEVSENEAPASSDTEDSAETSENVPDQDASAANESINPRGKTYFTKANIWFENPRKIFSTNYHKGAILPAGTKGTIRHYGRGKIQFTADNTGSTFTLVYIRKHGRMTMGEFFDHYFSEGDIMAEGGEFSQFTPEEQDNIKIGAIAEGMSKAAVLMAYGYPPKIKTPDISGDTWTYWKDRMNTVVVTFQDDKVMSIED